MAPKGLGYVEIVMNESLWHQEFSWPILGVSNLPIIIRQERYGHKITLNTPDHSVHWLNLTKSPICNIYCKNITQLSQAPNSWSRGYENVAVVLSPKYWRTFLRNDQQSEHTVSILIWRQAISFWHTATSTDVSIFKTEVLQEFWWIRQGGPEACLRSW